MSNIKLDLSKFKHISSDGKTTKLRHQDGHFLVLAHGALKDKNMKAQLEALSSMGKNAQTSDQANQMQDEKRVKMADGGKPDDGPSWVQSAKEMPGDFARAMKPANLAENTKLMYDSMSALAHGNPGVDSKGVYHAPDKKAEGGKVEVPNARYNDPKAEVKECGRKMSEGAMSGGPSLSQGLQNAKSEIQHVFGYADGGDVETLKAKDPSFSQPMPKQSDDMGPPGYDNSVAPAVDPGEQPRMPAAAQAPEVPKSQVETQKIYNSLVTGNARPEEQGTKAWAIFGPNGEPPKSFDANAWSLAEKQAEKMQIDSSQASQQKAQQIEQDNQVRARAGLPPIPVPGINMSDGIPAGAQPSPAEPQSQSMPPPQQVQQPDVSSAVNDSQGMLESGYNQKLASIEQQSQAQQQVGQEQQAALERNAQSQQNAQIQFKQHYDALEAERQNHIHDIQSGYIDPNQYWTGDKNGNGSHSKIATGIGMILAGFNPTNSPNAAVNFLKFQMEQNLQAQQANLGAKQNLLTANLRQFGNLKDAQDMTRLMQSDLMQNELQQAATKATTPMAKAAALSAAGQLKMEAAPMFQQFALRRAIMSSASNPNDPGATGHMIAQMRVLNPEMAKEMESRYVPGVGMAGIPVTPEVRQKLIAHQALDSTIKDLQKFVVTHTTLMPGTPDYVRGAQKALDLQTKIREGKLNTVYREGEQPLLDKFVKSNPAGIMKNLVTIPQLKELANSNAREFNTLKQAYSLPVTQATPEEQFKTVNGVKYKRGPNGEAIRVK